MPPSTSATPSEPPSRDLAGSLALVTGSGGGLGLGCARLLAARGADLILVDVRVEALDSAAAELRAAYPGLDVRSEIADLADPDSVRALAQRLLAQDRPLDLLIANAGIYPPSQRTLNAQGQELGFAIAVMGHYALIAQLWPLLERAPAARVVCVSSLTQRRARLYLEDLSFEQNYAPIRAYAQAKLGSLLLARALQAQLTRAGSRVRAQAAHPGVCRTGIGANRRRNPRDSTWQRFSSWALAFGMRFHGQTPEQGAAAVLEAATSTRIAPGDFVGPKGFLEAAGPIGVVEPGEAGRDPQLASALWARLEQITGLRIPI